jgi:hypothetical protein
MLRRRATAGASCGSGVEPKLVTCPSLCRNPATAAGLQEGRREDAEGTPDLVREEAEGAWVGRSGRRRAVLDAAMVASSLAFLSGF